MMHPPPTSRSKTAAARCMWHMHAVQERRLLVEQNLGAMPPLEDSTPPATRAPRRSPGMHVSVVPDADTPAAPDDAMQPPVPPRPPHPPPPALSLWPQQSPSEPLPLPPLPRQDDLETKPRPGDPSTSALPVASGAATEISSTADEIETEGDDDDKGGVPTRLVVVCSMASVAALALGITAVMLVMLWRQQQDQQEQEQEQEQKQLHQLHQLHQPRDMAELRVAVTKWTEGSQEGEEAPQAAVASWPVRRFSLRPGMYIYIYICLAIGLHKTSLPSSCAGANSSNTCVSMSWKPVRAHRHTSCHCQTEGTQLL